MDVQDWVALWRNFKEKVLNIRDDWIDHWVHFRGREDWAVRSKRKRTFTFWDRLPPFDGEAKTKKNTDHDDKESRE